MSIRCQVETVNLPLVSHHPSCDQHRLSITSSMFVYLYTKLYNILYISTWEVTGEGYYMRGFCGGIHGRLLWRETTWEASREGFYMEGVTREGNYMGS